jgi:hypothetical protein
MRTGENVEGPSQSRGDLLDLINPRTGKAYPGHGVNWGKIRPGGAGRTSSPRELL